MFDVRQWITWEPVQYEGEPKPRKIPCGGNDPHNPAFWTSFEVAKEITPHIGFVLTESDPYFCVDIDHALQPDGQWSQTAQMVCAMFPGAFMEVSHSGDGIHIFGRGKIPQGFKHKNTALGLEVYDCLRFIAVTCNGAHGDANTDHQAALTNFTYMYMEQAIAGNAEGWTTEPRSDWLGPEDDDELIERMLKSRPSADALWGGKATIRDLWYANEDVLRDSYPDPAGGFDQSSADMALATHLAFWTGANCERIERLMWRSGLARDKWKEHRTYLKEFTISKAVGACQRVYSDPRQAAVSNLPTTVEPQPQRQSPELTIRTGLQYLTPDAQIEFFKGCVYIINTHRVMRPNGTLVSPEQFKVIYGGYQFAMDAMNDKSTQDAWKVFTTSQAISFPKAEGVLFRPEMEPGASIEQEGIIYINSYQPTPVRMIDGDVSPFIDLLTKLFPVDQDRMIILSYMAACVQHAGVKFQWSPIIQGAEGNGKSFLTRVLIYAVGNRYSHLVNPKDIDNKFNAWIENKLFAGIEEVYVSDKRHLLDALKIVITNDRLEIQPKGGNQYMGDNRANFMMNSNHQDAIRKTKDDRRYAPFFTPQQSYEDICRDGMDGDYFPNLYKWAKADGYAIISNFLRQFEIPDELNPATKCHRAPRTSSTETAIEASLGPAEQEVVNAVGENVQGFRGGWVSSITLNRLLQQTGKARLIPQNKRSDMMERIGYIRLGRSNIEITNEGGRPILYLKKGQPCGHDVALEYMSAQGYVTPGV